ncbi:MAG: 3D domain-containing protein [Defluviitaleaceae bacterium]|nr:3D domain-containing protein [Defluviitaleaceae bacterium]
MRKLNKLAVGILSILAISFMGAAAYYAASPGVVFIDNGHTRNIEANGATVMELLDEMGVRLHQFDRITPDLDEEVYIGMVIEITRAIPVYIRLNGNNENLIPFHARPDATWARVVRDFEQREDGFDRYSFNRDEGRRIPQPGGIIDLRSIEHVTRYVYTDTPYQREYVESFLLPEGETKLAQPGAYGLSNHTYTVTFLAGIEYDKDLEYTYVIIEPQNEIMHIGVELPEGMAVSSCGTPFAYSRLVLMESTAYTLSFACTGRQPGHPLFGVTASGMMAQVGVVAVDTSVIPFHTRMYIEGYGFAVAGDRGGAIRGYKVDVFMDTMAEARQWGRRHNVRVWILE